MLVAFQPSLVTRDHVLDATAPDRICVAPQCTVEVLATSTKIPMKNRTTTTASPT
jgi:hypothetical protein